MRDIRKSRVHRAEEIVFFCIDCVIGVKLTLLLFFALDDAGECGDECDGTVVQYLRSIFSLALDHRMQQCAGARVHFI